MTCRHWKSVINKYSKKTLPLQENAVLSFLKHLFHTLLMCLALCLAAIRGIMLSQRVLNIVWCFS